MKNKAKWLSLLLLLPLLCGAGEAEAADDPRALWREAEAALEEYDCVDLDSCEEITLSINGEDTTVVTASRTRGTGLQGSTPAYKTVTTGDQIGEIYYANGTAYAAMPYGRWQSPMTAEDFQRLIGEGSVGFTEADFGSVELTGTENGYEISFSQPTEELTERLAEGLAEGFTAVSDAKVSGTLRLWEDGSFRESVLELSMTQQQPGGSEIPVSIYSGRTLLAHDGSVVVQLPDKIFSYAECEDLYAVQALYNAFTLMQNATRATYHTDVAFEGKIQDGTRAPIYESDTILERDLSGEHYRYYYDSAEYYIGSERKVLSDGYGLDLSPAEKTYYRLATGSSTTLELTDEEARTLMLAELHEFNSAATFPYYEDITAEYTEETIEISFRPSREMCSVLASYVFEKQMNSRKFSAFVQDRDEMEISDASGFVVLNGDGKPESIHITFYGSIWPESAWVTNGTFSYHREIGSVNEAVEFPEYLSISDRAEKEKAENG